MAPGSCPSAIAHGAVLLLATVLLAACGGGGSKTHTPQKAAPSPTGAKRDFVVTRGGRVLRGWCEGPAHAGKPTIVMEAGQGNDSAQLEAVAHSLAPRWRVCGYDRAGLGSSDPEPGARRSLADLLADEHAVLSDGQVRPPFVLVGHSLGAMLDLLYMQRYPDGIAGVVAMNPGPTYHDWIARLRGMVTPEELLKNEIEPLSGRGPDVAGEPVDTRESDALLNYRLPPSIPYVVMYAEDCDSGRDRYCNKVGGKLEASQRALARRTPRGRFVAVPGAGHEIFASDARVVVKTIEGLARHASD
jgi:pimeloyl-ACP methyl ester carboxylesterase